MRYIRLRLRYYYFRFLNTNGAKLEFYIRFDGGLCLAIVMSFCISLPNFVVIGRSAAEF